MPSRQTGEIGRDDHSVVAPEAVRQLLGLLAANGLTSKAVDAPSDPNGEWFIDLAINDLNTTVSYRPGFGFGIFTSDPLFGARPDEVYRDPKAAAIRLRQLASQWARDARLTSPSLRDLRLIMGMHQTHVAQAWGGGGDQTTISRLEMRDDHKLSTILDYVAALGGQLELRARFDAFEAPIDVSRGSTRNMSLRDNLRLSGPLPKYQSIADLAHNKDQEPMLRDVLEMAGLRAHIDYVDEAFVEAESFAHRPDLIVKLPGGMFVIDAKCSLNAFLEARDSTVEPTRDAALDRHAQCVSSYVTRLSSKHYWDQFDAEDSPEFVAAYFPGDAFLNLALDRLPDLVTNAARNRVLLVTPASLFAVCTAMAHVPVERRIPVPATT
jgi:hypothetical protein